MMSEKIIRKMFDVMREPARPFAQRFYETLYYRHADCYCPDIHPPDADIIPLIDALRHY